MHFTTKLNQMHLVWDTSGPTLSSTSISKRRAQSFPQTLFSKLLDKPLCLMVSFICFFIVISHIDITQNIYVILQLYSVFFTYRHYIPRCLPDSCADKFLLVSMGGQAEGLACEDLVARPPSALAEIHSIF